jgi:hypothetical protein
MKRLALPCAALAFFVGASGASAQSGALRQLQDYRIITFDVGSPGPFNVDCGRGYRPLAVRVISGRFVASLSQRTPRSTAVLNLFDSSQSTAPEIETRVGLVCVRDPRPSGRPIDLRTIELFVRHRPGPVPNREATCPAGMRAIGIRVVSNRLGAAFDTPPVASPAVIRLFDSAEDARSETGTRVTILCAER